MQAGRFCLDTNAVIEFLEGDEALVQLIRKGHEELLLSSVVVGELLFGARNSAQADTNLERYRRFVYHCRVTPIDEDTAEVYATVRKELRSGGFKIPDNDIWIAASAMQHDAVVVTRDRHFSHVEGVTTRSW